MITAFFGEQVLKDALLERLREHQRFDLIVQGEYYDGRRGCHLGCITHAEEDHHAKTEQLFGIPVHVAYWLESVFEGLPIDKAKQWVTDSIEAIPAGADMSLVHHRFVVWLLGPESPSAEGNKHPIVRDAISQVRLLHEMAARGAAVNFDAAWRAARSAGLRAEAELAKSAEMAAWSAAGSATRSRTSVARSVKKVVSERAWVDIAEKSIELFASCPVVECGACGQRIEASRRHLSTLHLRPRFPCSRTAATSVESSGLHKANPSS